MSVTIGTGQSSSSFPDAAHGGDEADAAAFAALLAQPPQNQPSQNQPPQDGPGGVVAGQVNAFYQDLLGQNADPAAVATIRDALAGGQSLAQVETDLRPLLARSDAATATINAFYHQSFNRAATPDELGNIEGALAGGQSLLGIETRLNPAGTSGNPTLGTVNDLYQRLFGRNALPEEVDGFMDAATRGVSAQDYAAFLQPAFAQSDAEAGTVNAFYRQSFKRDPTADDLRNIEGALAGGQSLLGIEARLDPDNTSANPTLAAINDLYQRLFGRNALPGEVDSFVDALAHGQSVQASVAALRPAFAQSDAEMGTVNALYRQNFKRDPTADDLRNVEGALSAGQSLLGIEARLDPDNTSANPTLAAINDLYQRLFGRNALPGEVDSFVDALAGGESVQASVAALRSVFAKSPAEADTINAFYRQSFKRDPTPGDLLNVEGVLSAGQSLLGIEARLDPDNTSANPTLGAINDFYQRLFGRNALPHEVDSFVDALAGGESVQASVAALRPTFAKSQAEADTINAFYQEVAGRPAHSDELLNIEGALAGGQALDDIELAQTPGLLAEARAQRQARADATDATYRQVFNRGASAAELSDREREFANGQTMGGMRDGLAHSPEAAADIDRLYQDLFGHGVDGPSQGVIQAQLAAGASLGDYRGSFARTSPAVGSAIADTFAAAGRRAPSGPEMDYWRSRLAEGGSLGDLRAALAQGHATDYLAFHPGLSPGFFPAPIPYHPAIDPEEGYAPPAEPVTLLGADGSVLASNAARDVLAVLPVYVTLNGGQSPSLRLGDGSTLRFSNAVELAGYLNRTAQRASPNDPLLGTAYGQTSAWLQQVDQPVLETAIRYAQLARDGDKSQAGLHGAASALARQILQQDPGQRHALSTKVKQNGHETTVTVGVDGTATFHDKDAGPWSAIESVATIVVDVLAVVQPEIGVPLAVALNAAQAGQALADGNVLGGVLSLAQAATFGTSSLALSVATRVAGGVSAIVQGAQRGDAAGIIGGVLATAGGVAAGLNVGGAGFTLGDGPGAVTVDLQHALSAAGALTSFGAQVAQGRLTDGLLNSLGPWLAGLAAENYAKGNTLSPAANGGSSNPGTYNKFAGPGAQADPNDNASLAADGNTVVRYAKSLVTGIGIGIADIAQGLFYIGQAGVKFLVDATAVSTAADGGFALDDPDSKKLNAAAQQQLAQDVNQAGRAVQGTASAILSAAGDPVGTATDLYNRYKAAEAEAAANGTLAEFYGRFTGRLVVEGGATVLTALEMARGLGLLIRVGDLASLGAFDVTALTPVASSTRGTVSAAKFGNDGVAIPVTDAADQALARQVMTLGDPSGSVSEALVSSVARKEGVVELSGGKYGGNNGFDHVFQNKDGSITILMETKQLPDGAAQLNPSAAGGQMQMSDAWINNVLDKLDRNSAAFKAVTAARDNGTLFKAVVGVDRVTGNLNLVRLK